MAPLVELPDWAAMAPILAFAATALVLFVLDSLESEPDSLDRTVLTGVGLLGSLSALVLSGWFLLAGTGQTGGPVELFDGSIVVDGMSLFFTALIGSVTALVVLASHDYIAGEDYQAEYYSLVFLAATGMAMVASVNSLAAAFVAIELVSLPSYALVAYLKHNRGSVEAGLKYFLIGALSSAIFVYGISLVYGATGYLRFDLVANEIGGDLAGVSGILGLGILMIVGGIAFKTAAVPFHFWAPEAYEGAASPISGFLSSASKAAGFVLAFRVFTVAFPLEAVSGTFDWALAFTVLAIVTMTLGNFAAATQEKVKRMLAYSSIGHAGYVLMALAAITGTGSEAAIGGVSNDALVLGAGMMHLLVYGFMNTGAFLFIALTEHWGVGRQFEDFNGLWREAPIASLSMTIFMFSLAGLPVGAGFLSKYFLFLGTIGAGLWWLVVIALINSALSLYYYSRVVKAMWIEEPANPHEIESYPTGLYAAVVGAAVVTVLLLPGFGPVADEAIAAAAALI
jgi:proton-translocating NADH-quinone oxidoreductase chain N